MFGPAALVVVLAFGAATPALGWISGARLAQPTPAQAASGGVDLTIDTHQWFADRALAVLAGDGHDNVTRFFDSIDPTAPGATSAEGARGPFTYRWRLLRGASDADGVLYRNVRDHFHNFWTHRGRQWVLGGSAASNAEKSYQRAVDLWSKGQRGEAVYWLGAAVHLLDDACVPQHEYFALNPYHHQYELWVQRHQDQLAVSSAGIYRGQFRADDGHGGDDWSSSHPRGWVDECAHRAVRILRAASHPNGAGDGSPNDPQWRTADHIAASQRLTAGFVMLFFDRVGAP